MKAKGFYRKVLAASVALFTTLVMCGVASSAPFHNQTDCTACHDFDAFDCGSHVNIKAIMCTVNSQDVNFQVIPADYARSDGEGVCQACHFSAHVTTDKVGEDCTGCHGDHCPPDYFMAGGAAPDDVGHNFHLFKDPYTTNPKLGAPLDCEDCHVGGVYDELSVMVGLGVCDACHSPDGAYDGVLATVGDGAVGPMADRFFRTMSDIQYGKSEDPMGWIEPV